MTERFDRGLPFSPKFTRELADFLQVFEELGLPPFAAFERFMFELLGVQVELGDSGREPLALKDFEVFFAVEVKRVLWMRVVHKCP